MTCFILYPKDKVYTLREFLLDTQAFPSETQLMKAFSQGQIKLRKPQPDGAIKDCKVTRAELDLAIEDLDCTNMVNGFTVKTGKTTGIVVKSHHNHPKGYIVNYETGW